ncbi:AraC family transcriptional regulator [Nocardia sp. NPDC057353]|uniref:helix-turn-helix transcriptional regulator n=1 Tax=Nocardia sp. NPDC057353 TaxID=3346104 RepID=UPI00363C5FE2
MIHRAPRAAAPPSLHIPARAALSVVVPVRGGAVLVTADHRPQRLDPGELAIVRGGEAHVVADSSAAGPRAVAAAQERRAAPSGELLGDLTGTGARRWAAGPLLLVHGSYAAAGVVSRRLLQALPPLVVLRDHDLDHRTLALLGDEAARDRSVVLDRLLDLVVTGALRAWFARGTAPAWYAAYRDPLVGGALRLLQQHPAHRWTVAELAAAVGVSRAALARRFTTLVGLPPMAFLTEWRLALAAERLRDSDDTVETIAHHVGYGTAFALSAAFKRQHGIAPRDYRSGGARTPRPAVSASTGAAESPVTGSARGGHAPRPRPSSHGARRDPPRSGASAAT